VVPVVAVEINAAEVAPALQTVLLDACTSGLRTARCVAAGQDESPAKAVAIVSWSSEAAVRIEVGVERSDQAQWRARELGFSPSDPPSERWKAAGYTIALLVGEQAPPPDMVPSLEAPPSQAPLPEGPGLLPYFDLKAVTGSGLVGDAWRLGGELRFSLASSRALWFGSVAARYAAAAADAPELHVRWLDIAAGGGASVARSAEFELRARAEVLLENVAASAERQGLTARRSIWVPGVRIGADAVWPNQGQWAAVGSVDAFWLDGSTPVTIEQARVAESAGVGVAFSAGVEWRL
jgi:hypothetical protein